MQVACDVSHYVMKHMWIHLCKEILLAIYIFTSIIYIMNENKSVNLGTMSQLAVAIWLITIYTHVWTLLKKHISL